jgi:heme A synthase
MTPDARAGRLARYAWGVLAANVAVVLWGAFVRATGSGAGCGSHWPRCDGRVIPRLASTAQVIEFTHRATSGIALLLVVGLLAWSFRATPRGHPARTGAVLSMFFMLTEAGVGAGLVLFGLVDDDRSGARAGALAVHLTNTFLLLGALALTAWWASGGRRVRARGRGVLSWALPSALVLTIVVGITGAVTALGDTLFPKTRVGLDAGSTAHFLERLRVVHPLVAIATALSVVAVSHLVRRLRPSPEATRLSIVLTLLFAAQVVAGAVNVVLLAPVWMQIVHLLLADAVWISLVLTTAAAFAEQASPAEAESIAPNAGKPAAGTAGSLAATR